MKLFTKADNAKLFANYSKGSDMANQNVVVKIFNPYNRGTWFIMNSDPNDPDYLWGIVDLGQGVEVGSISRSDLENYRNRFGWGFERDTSFSPKNAKMVLEGLRNGEFFADGGEVEFIEYGDSEIMFEPHYKKYYANDMEFDTLEEAKKFVDSGEVPQHIRDAYAKGLFSGGGGVKRKMALSDSVIYKDKLWYITEKDGVVGLINFKQGAWGTNYPFIPLSKISQSEITDMMGREVEIPYMVEDFKKGGGVKTTFAEKSNAIAKNFVGKSVEPKYQKEYGKRYDAKEAKEVGNKIAGKQKATYDKKNMKRGGSTKQASRMTLLTQKAKEIRKEGEAWRDALKRANAMMK